MVLHQILTEALTRGQTLRNLMLLHVLTCDQKKKENSFLLWKGLPKSCYKKYHSKAKHLQEIYKNWTAVQGPAFVQCVMHGVTLQEFETSDNWLLDLLILKHWSTLDVDSLSLHLLIVLEIANYSKTKHTKRLVKLDKNLSKYWGYVYFS